MENKNKKCKVEGCKRTYRAKGYCTVHFHQWRRGEMPKKSRYKTCGEENCRKPLFRFGLCETHYAERNAKKGGETAPTPATEQTAPS